MVPHGSGRKIAPTQNGLTPTDEQWACDLDHGLASSHWFFLPFSSQHMVRFVC